MLKISEFSRLTRVPAKTLRYYDEIGLFQPFKIDSQSNYRYYAVEQLAELNSILALKALGLSLEQIMILVNENVSGAQLRGMLRLKQVEINQHMLEEQQRLQFIDATLRQLDAETPEQAANTNRIEVIVKQIEPQHVVSIREIVPHLTELGGASTRAFTKLYTALEANLIPPIGAGMALYHNLEFDEQNIDLEICVPIESTVSMNFGDDTIICKTLPAVELMACALHSGNYQDLGAAHMAVLHWITLTTYEIDTPNREVFLQYSPDPAKNITEIQYPMRVNHSVHT
jgi:DNA-binding transcriptional MerR regulator